MSQATSNRQHPQQAFHSAFRVMCFDGTRAFAAPARLKGQVGKS